MSTTYNAKVYMEQGATKMVCCTGGEIEMRTGSLLDQQDGSTATFKGVVNFSSADVNMLKGSTVTFSSGANLRLSSGAKFRLETIQVMTTKGSTAVTSFLHNYGISVIRPNGTGGNYILKRPVKGIMKHIIIQSTLVNKIRSTSTAIMFGDTATPQQFVFTVTPSTQVDTKHAGWGIPLVGISSNVWCPLNLPIGSSLKSGIMAMATAT